jgi:hypothetical protein
MEEALAYLIFGIAPDPPQTNLPRLAAFKALPMTVTSLQKATPLNSEPTDNCYSAALQRWIEMVHTSVHRLLTRQIAHPRARLAIGVRLQ